MGAAHLAAHPILSVPRVIKTFKVRQRDMFREAHLAARVSCPNTVAVLDAGIENGIPFIIQPYVDGIDISELMAFTVGDWVPPVGTVARVVAGAARGVHTIHQFGVIHRDIKPANLFLRGNGVCAVGDFGVAVDMREDDGAIIAGTPLFMAPELWDGGASDRRTDVYALGCTAHVLATGATPFPDGTLPKIARAHKTARYKRPEDTSPEAAYLFAVVDKALSKNPDDRFPTAEALARALQQIATPVPRLQIAGDRGHVGDIQVTLLQGDIADESADVLVNSANTGFIMNSGVGESLARIGGRELRLLALDHAPGAIGDVVWTAPGKLDARHVAHAVAAERGAICVQRCALRVLLGAETRQARSVVLPALGAGAGQVPMSQVATLLLQATRVFAGLRPRYVRDVRFVLNDTEAMTIWRHVSSGEAHAGVDPL